eukprot:3931745-Rhodomonas_salina.2
MQPPEPVLMALATSLGSAQRPARVCCRLAEDVGTGSGTGEMGALAERVDGALREADGGG